MASPCPALTLSEKGAVVPKAAHQGRQYEAEGEAPGASYPWSACLVRASSSLRLSPRAYRCFKLQAGIQAPRAPFQAGATTGAGERTEPLPQGSTPQPGA
jgi:hypothetical protein